MSEDGLIAVVSTVDRRDGLLMSGPEVVSRGFVYVRDNEPLIDEAKKLVQQTILQQLNGRERFDHMRVKTRVRDELSRFFFAETKRSPVILPIVMEV